MKNEPFSNRHPWLSRKLKKKLWSFLGWMNLSSFTFHLAGSDLKFSVNPKDDSVGKFIFLEGYELETLLFCSRFISEGDQVFDIGANIGYFTVLFSAYVGNSGEVHSFEPSRREFLHLCKNLSINKIRNVFLNQVAVSDQNGFTELNTLDDDCFGAYNSINDVTHQKVRQARTHIEVTRRICIDSYLEVFPERKPSLMKIDVEGHEKQVLEGMKSLLISSNAPCLVVEVCEGTHQNEQDSAQSLSYYLKKFDYELFSPDNRGNLKPFVLGKSLNCIALKPIHSQRLLERKIEFSTIN